MYKCRKFTIQELVHPRILNSIGENNSWLRLDEKCLIELDYIRDEWGDIIYINLNKNDSRGLRPPDDEDGAQFSTHKQGNTFDLVPKNGKYKELWDMIYKMISEKVLHSFNTMEHYSHTPTWVHIAKMNTYEKPLIINP